MTEPVVLTTARLELSIPVADDVDAITAACQDPDIQRWTTVPSPYTRADAENFVAAYVTAGWQSGATRTWAVRSRGPEGLAFVGMVGLDGIRDGEGEIGYWLVPSARGDGIMPEAVAAVIDYGFSSDGPALQRIQWHAYAGNVPSARLARRAGLRFEGTRRLGAPGRDGREDEWEAAILATDDRSPADGWPVEALGA